MRIIIKSMMLCLLIGGLPAYADVDKAHWMEQLYKDRPHTRIRDMVIPASHDAGAYAMSSSSDIAPGETGWYNLAKSVVAAWGNTQNQNAYQQLQGGIRSLDLRVLHHKGQPVIVHGLVSVSLETMLIDIQRWVREHPKELVILEFAKNPVTQAEQEHMHQLVMQYLGDRVLDNAYTPSTFTLSDAWQANKNVVLLTSAGYLHQSYNSWWNAGAYLEGVYGDTTSLSSMHASLINGRGNRPGLNNQNPDKWHNISITFTPAADAISRGIFGKLIDAFSREDTPRNLWELTQQLKFAAAEWIPGWVAEGKKVNFVSADFYQETKIVDVAIAMNYPDVPAPQGKLSLQTVNQYQWIYDDHDTGADEDVSIWRPKTAYGFYPLSYVSHRSHSYPGFASQVVMAEDNTALVNPIGYSWVWDDRSSGGTHDVNVWAGIAPRGYSCLGHVATLGYRVEPAADAIKCVHNSYLTTANNNNRIWNDRDSGAYIDAGFWSVQANDTNAHNSAAFIANRMHWNSATPFAVKAIRKDRSQDASLANVGYRMLMDQASGKCLTVKYNQAFNGQDIILHTCNNGPNQRWQYDATTGFLRSAMPGNFCLDNRGNLNNGAKLGLHHCVDHNNLRWDWQGTGLVNRNDGNVAMDASCRDDYCLIVNYRKHGGANQQWHWQEVLSFRNKERNQCMSMAGHPVEYTRVVPSACDNSAAQQFMYWNGLLKPLANPSMCLDIKKAELKNGAEIISWPCHGKTNQRWTISNDVLTSNMNGNSHSIGENPDHIVMWEHYNNLHQRWEITRH